MKMFLGLFEKNLLEVFETDFDPKKLDSDLAKVPEETLKELSGTVANGTTILSEILGFDLKGEVTLVWSFKSREQVVEEFYQQFFYLENIKDVKIVFNEGKQGPETQVQNR